MTDINIKSFFSQISGDDKIVDKSDLVAGRIDKNIAKALGIIDENGNYTDKTYTQEHLESGAYIEKLLKNVRKRSDNFRTEKDNSNEKKVFDIMNSELKRNNPSEPDKKTENKERTNNPKKQNLTIEQPKEIIRKSSKDNT